LAFNNNHDDLHQRILIGNGASELIDLVTRLNPSNNWKPGPWKCQYKEYERAAKALGFNVVTNSDQNYSMTAIINPNNPTGDYMNINEMKSYLEKLSNDTIVLVDESMQPWLSKDFKSDSLLSQSEFIENLSENRNIHIYIIHSWTKLWSCTGLRLGSLICPTKELAFQLQKKQVPWSVNGPALCFLSNVIKDSVYLENTWEFTKLWRFNMINDLLSLMKQKNFQWELLGKDFLSWIWINMKDPIIADKACSIAKKAGVPIRPGKYGYGCDQFVRIAVRPQDKWNVLYNAWLKYL
jgi:histidinol-phosphate/aromatic aminotransferase/cobyric acid decarboxylase-like protein